MDPTNEIGKSRRGTVKCGEKEAHVRRRKQYVEKHPKPKPRFDGRFVRVVLTPGIKKAGAEYCVEVAVDLGTWEIVRKFHSRADARRLAEKLDRMATWAYASRDVIVTRVLP